MNPILEVGGIRHKGPSIGNKYYFGFDDLFSWKRAMLTNRRNRGSADTRHCLCLGPTNLASISYLKGPYRETILTHQ